MIDFDLLEEYRENNRIEAKKAWGGLPKSIWETYSAFANTLGGVILLGVMESRENQNLYAVGLPDPEGLRAEFFRLLNTPGQVSANLLREENVSLHFLEDKSVLAIEVPRAHSRLRPVYVGGDLYAGCYRRNGEGDYRCTPEEIQTMLRDQAAVTDCQPLPVSLDALDPSAVQSFSALLQKQGLHLSDAGATAFDACGSEHPTIAGLLFLGRFKAIQAVFPHFSLSLGSPHLQPFSGNLYAFWQAAFSQLKAHLSSLSLDASLASDAESAMLGALGNALAHADYYLPGGIQVALSPDRVEISNSGAFRLSPDEALLQGIRDPRNETLLRLLSFVGGSGSSSGSLSQMYGVWQRIGWQPPALSESFGPDRTTLILPLTSKKMVFQHPGGDSLLLREAILDYLLRYAHASSSELSALVGLSSASLSPILARLEEENLLCRDRENPSLWRLREKA